MFTSILVYTTITSNDKLNKLVSNQVNLTIIYIIYIYIYIYIYIHNIKEYKS